MPVELSAADRHQGRRRLCRRPRGHGDRRRDATGREVRGRVLPVRHDGLVRAAIELLRHRRCRADHGTAARAEQAQLADRARARADRDADDLRQAGGREPHRQEQPRRIRGRHPRRLPGDGEPAGGPVRDVPEPSRSAASGAGGIRPDVARHARREAGRHRLGRRHARVQGPDHAAVCATGAGIRADRARHDLARAQGLQETRRQGARDDPAHAVRQRAHRMEERRPR